MNSPTVFLAVDAANLYSSLEPSKRLNYGALIEYVSAFGAVADSAIYLPRLNGPERERSRLLSLKQQGFSRIVCRLVRQRPNGGHKSDLDTVLTLDVWTAAMQESVNNVVLVSGDSDFVPLVERLIEWGIRVHVIGPERATAWEMIVTPTPFARRTRYPGSSAM